MKIITTFISVTIIALLIFLGIYIFRDKDINYAIDQFEDGDYIESIQMLNELSQKSDYETGEKIYYYRCRGINRLANQIDAEYNDELYEIALEKKGSPDYDKAKKDIEEELDDINNDIKGDLKLISARKRSSIISNGRFYEEFTSGYRGSSYIEDLDFEELQKINKTEPDRSLNTIIQFYKKFPNTNYISHIIKMLFDKFQKGDISFNNNQTEIMNMIITYGKRYRSSSEINKIFRSAGNNVNIRNSPGLNGKPVGKIIQDEILIQVEKSMDKSQIGDTRDYWYKIITLKGQKGWIFGKFLTPFEISGYNHDEKNETWSIEENFITWSNSNTPENWRHIPGADKKSISFTTNGNITLANINSLKGKTSGLFSRYNAIKAFKIFTKARYIRGSGITIFSYSMGNGKVYSIKLKEEEIEISKRKIPLHTSDWHEYMLKSEDGRYAKLFIDGEVISGRIPPEKNKEFPLRGIYCMYSSESESSQGEMEFLKVK